MRTLRLIASVLAMGLAAGTCSADPLGVVATGDSLTLGYAPFLPACLTNLGITAEVTTIASGGNTTRRYLGLEQDYDAGNLLPPRDYTAAVLDASPDVILFMLGANDAVRIQFLLSEGRDSEYNFAAYQANLAGVFDRFAADPGGPIVLLSTVTPILVDPLEEPVRYAANEMIEAQINPWLRQEAAGRGLVLVDMSALLTAQPNWQDMIDEGGVHLVYPTGRQWMADQFAAATLAAVPEPATVWLAVAGLGAMAGPLRRRLGSVRQRRPSPRKLSA